MLARRPFIIRSNGRKVLIATADDALRQAVAAAFARARGAPYHILEAALGWTALSLINRERPDCVLLASRLPDIDSLTICRHASLDTGAVVVLMTAQTDLASLSEWASAGAHGRWLVPQQLNGSQPHLQQVVRCVDLAIADAGLARNRFRHQVNCAMLQAALAGRQGQRDRLHRWPDLESRAWSPDGQMVAACSMAAGVHVWHRQARWGYACAESASSWFYHLAWSPNGQTLAAGALDGTIWLWDTCSGALQRRLDGHSTSVLGVAWSPDSGTLASCSLGTTVRLWEPHTGALRRALRGHTATVSAIAWSPDGHLLASTSLDGTVRLWDAHTGELCYRYSGSTHPAVSMAWSPDGQTLASRSSDTAGDLLEMGAASSR